MITQRTSPVITQRTSPVIIQRTSPVITQRTSPMITQRTSRVIKPMANLDIILGTPKDQPIDQPRSNQPKDQDGDDPRSQKKYQSRHQSTDHPGTKPVINLRTNPRANLGVSTVTYIIKGKGSSKYGTHCDSFHFI